MCAAATVVLKCSGPVITRVKGCLELLAKMEVNKTVRKQCYSEIKQLRSQLSDIQLKDPEIQKDAKIIMRLNCVDEILNEGLNMCNSLRDTTFIKEVRKSLLDKEQSNTLDNLRHNLDNAQKNVQAALQLIKCYVTDVQIGIVSERDISVSIHTEMIIPGKPGKPKALNVTHDSIQLEWTKPEQGAHNITTYTVLYRSTDDPGNKWSEYEADRSEKALLSQLSENMAYCFKVRPECKKGTGLESDISDPIHTKMIIPGKPGKPKASSVTHDSIQLEWTKPEQGAHSITTYTIFYCSTSDPSDKWSEYEVNTNEKALLPQLSENTVYYFKVRPECEAGTGLESDISNPIKTEVIVPSKPGKPKAVSITHNDVQLEWTKPEAGAHNITSYVIFYRSSSDPADQWINNFETTTAEVMATVTNLEHSTTYYFKLQPKYDGGVSSESDISNSIKTEEMLLFTIVYHKLWKARRKWYNIGLCLKLDKTDLYRYYRRR